MSAAITHQDILDRAEALGQEYSAAYQAEKARLDKERESLRELCGGIGHVFGRGRALLAWPVARRSCVFCGAPEPDKA